MPINGSTQGRPWLRSSGRAPISNRGDAQAQHSDRLTPSEAPDLGTCLRRWDMAAGCRHGRQTPSRAAPSGGEGLTAEDGRAQGPEGQKQRRGPPRLALLLQQRHQRQHLRGAATTSAQATSAVGHCHQCPQHGSHHALRQRRVHSLSGRHTASGGGVEDSARTLMAPAMASVALTILKTLVGMSFFSTAFCMKQSTMKSCRHADRRLHSISG